jgi:plasmid stability protein
VATIQIRDIPDGGYETINRRARAAGQSLQAYTREHVVEWGSSRTKAEVFAEMEELLARDRGTGVPVEQVLADRDADRR